MKKKNTQKEKKKNTKNKYKISNKKQFVYDFLLSLELLSKDVAPIGDVV